MTEMQPKWQQIMEIFLWNDSLSSSDVFAQLVASREAVAHVTVKRALTEMAKAGLLKVSGSGRSTRYQLAPYGRLFIDVDVKRYCSEEPDKRAGLARFNFELLPALTGDLFTEEELETLRDATDAYRKNTEGLSPVLQKKEWERLIIELSWKSSKIEGNTYTLLDTERLIRENEPAPGHTLQEAKMILNHKDAFTYIRENPQRFRVLTRKNLEEIHAILVDGLNVGVGLRSKPVGVTGSRYVPLDNIHQITEAIADLERAVSRLTNPYAKALMALLGVGYIQPFEDGNKRTSRLMANALLFSHRCTPLSYRSIDKEEYLGAVLVFYELNSVIPMKKIFIDQYLFATQHYAVK